MGDDLYQTACLYAADKVPGSEGSLSRGTPHVDSIGVQDQDPGVPAGHYFPQAVKAHFVIGSDKDMGSFIGIAQGIKPGIHPVMHPPDPPACLKGAKAIASDEGRPNPGNLAHAGAYGSDHKGLAGVRKTRLSLFCQVSTGGVPGRGHGKGYEGFRLFLIGHFIIHILF